MTQSWRWLIAVAVVSFALNYVWEVAQMAAFTTGNGQPFPEGIAFAIQHCFVPTLGDALVACGTFFAGWILYRRADWIRMLSRRDILVISLALVGVAILVEIVNVHLLNRWGYSSRMPVVPILGVGLLPLIQLALLTLLTFRIVGRVLRQSERARA